MPQLTRSIPKYRKHRASGQAVVTLSGKDHYLGPYGTKASRFEYDRLVSEWLQNGRTSPRPLRETTVVEVLAAYLKFAATYYRKDGKPTKEVPCIKEAVRFLRDLYGRTPAVDFGPLSLRVVQDRMVQSGMSRRVINRHIGRIRRMFRWAVGQMVPSSVHQGLAAVPGLRKGRTAARETAPVAPADDSSINAMMPHTSPVVRDMVQFQRLTGARPGEVCILRPCDVDRAGAVWAYKPESHKTEHHERQRVIFIGPKAQDVLRPYLLRPDDVCCFSPSEAMRRLRADRHAARKTPLSYGNRPGTNRKKCPHRHPGDRYTSDSYRRAIHRACDKADVPRWSPNQLRHTTATEIRKRFGLEAAQVTLGHARADVIQVYAERDMEKAAAVMAEVG